MNIYGVNQVKADFANGGYYKTFSFNDITSGSNGGFNASVSWDAVTGMGSLAKYTPIVKTTTLLNSLKQQTTTNKVFSIKN